MRPIALWFSSLSVHMHSALCASLSPAPDSVGLF